MRGYGYGYGRQRSYFGVGVTAVVIVILLAIGLIYNAVFYSTHTTVALICSKERTATSGGGEYRIYTADKGTFVIRDMHWFGHWRTDSADVYGKLHAPGAYRLTYVGVRIGLFSKFPNITRFTRLPADKSQLRKCND